MAVVRQTDEFRKWLDSLRDMRAQVRVAARIRQIESGNLGDWKQLTSAVGELRIDFGPGYRLYFTRRGDTVVILLVGGSKSRQASDIRRAIRLESSIGEEV